MTCFNPQVLNQENPHILSVLQMFTDKILQIDYKFILTNLDTKALNAKQFSQLLPCVELNHYRRYSVNLVLRNSNF